MARPLPFEKNNLPRIQGPSRTIGESRILKLPNEMPLPTAAAAAAAAAAAGSTNSLTHTTESHWTASSPSTTVLSIKLPAVATEASAQHQPVQVHRPPRGTNQRNFFFTFFFFDEIYVHANAIKGRERERERERERGRNALPFCLEVLCALPDGEAKNSRRLHRPT
eukprot:TsM_000026000 transcript=TsM_000026000 gene=TsM_000026000